MGPAAALPQRAGVWNRPPRKHRQARKTRSGEFFSSPPLARLSVGRDDARARWGRREYRGSPAIQARRIRRAEARAGGASANGAAARNTPVPTPVDRRTRRRSRTWAEYRAGAPSVPGGRHTRRIRRSSASHLSDARDPCRSAVRGEPKQTAGPRAAPERQMARPRTIGVSGGGAESACSEWHITDESSRPVGASSPRAGHSTGRLGSPTRDIRPTVQRASDGTVQPPKIRSNSHATAMVR